MLINDPIYGKVKINEPVLIELVKSPSLQRLKKISQYGVPDKYYHQKNYSRYEHSLGVMALLQKIGATLEEQVAGLIHDTSHLAFSHIADWVFSNGGKKEDNENLQNTMLKAFLSRKKILAIFEKYNLSFERLSAEENFPLLEKPIPDLCADRIDYALREFKYWLNPKIIKTCLNGLINYNGEFVFNDQQTAFLFASNFLELQTHHWGGYESAIRYHLFSNVLKKSLKERIITKRDFYKDDKYIIQKIENSKNEEILKVLFDLRKRKLKNFNASLGEKIYKKFRYVDPKIPIKNNLVRLSEIDPKFNKLIAKHRKTNKQGFTI